MEDYSNLAVGLGPTHLLECRVASLITDSVEVSINATRQITGECTRARKLMMDPEGLLEFRILCCARLYLGFIRVGCTFIIERDGTYYTMRAFALYFI